MEDFNKPLTVCDVVLNRNFSSVHKKRDTTKSYHMWHIHATSVLSRIQKLLWVRRVLLGKEVHKKNYP